MLVQSSGLFHVVCLKCLFGGWLISIVQGGLGNAVPGELVFRWQGEAIRHNRLIRLLGFFIHRMKWDGKCLFSTENSRNGLGDCVHARRSWAVEISLQTFRKSQCSAIIQPDAINSRLRGEIKRLPVGVAPGHVVRMLRAVQCAEVFTFG